MGREPKPSERAARNAIERRVARLTKFALSLPEVEQADPGEHVGVKPEVWVEAKPDAFDDTRDPVLEAALKHLRGISRTRRGPARGK